MALQTPPLFGSEARAVDRRETRGAAASPLPQADRAWRLFGISLIAAATCIAAAQGARAQPAPGPEGGPPKPMMHGGHRGPAGAGMMLFAGPPEHVARHVDRMLDGLNASDAQRTQIKQIAQAAAADLKTQHDAGKALRDRQRQVFAAPTVDANAAESLRQQMLAQHDQASRRVLTAMLDISRVLTPEQRATLAQREQQQEAVMQDRMQRMQRERANAPARS
jgi:Spy/CpxP family protein refolding chaperone